MFDSDPEASAQATEDFIQARSADDATDPDESVGRQLAAGGYVVVEDFKVVGEGA